MLVSGTLVVNALGLLTDESRCETVGMASLMMGFRVPEGVIERLEETWVAQQTRGDFA